MNHQIKEAYKTKLFYTPHKRPGGGHIFSNCFSSHMLTMCVFVCNLDNILMGFHVYFCTLLFLITGTNVVIGD